MDKDFLTFLILVTGSLTTAILFTNPVTVTLAIMIGLFYTVQIIGKTTIILHQEYSTAFYPLTICYVCGAVGGTWILAGLIPLLLGYQILPKIFILYLAGLSALAIAQGSHNLWKAPNDKIQNWFKYTILIIFGAVELTLGLLFTQHVPGVIVLTYLLGVGTLKTAELFDRYRYHRSKNYGTPYYDIEENAALLVLVTSILTILYLIFI